MATMEPLNMKYDDEVVQKAIAKALEQFYEKLTANVRQLNLLTVLKKKNPYLYRAKGVSSAAQIVSNILAAYVSSSEETIFGNVFFEPIAIAVAGGQKAVTEGVDITVDKDNTIYSIAVKSGTSVFNADSRKRQEQNFMAAQKRAQQAHKAFVPVIGYGYGRKKQSTRGLPKLYTELAGQDFWEWLTGEKFFYSLIIDFMGTKPDEYARQFEEVYSMTENRMVGSFIDMFCYPTGEINWRTLVQFNSGNEEYIKEWEDQ